MLFLVVVDHTDQFGYISMKGLRFSIVEYFAMAYFCRNRIGKDYLHDSGMYQLYHALFSDDLVLIKRTIYSDIIGNS